MRPWLLLVLLAGCSTPAPVDIDPIHDQDGWTDGDWWTYRVDGAESGEVTLVADVGAEVRLLVTDTDVARSSTADGFGFSGVYDGYVRNGSVLVPSGINSAPQEASIRWLPENLTEDATWSFGDTTGTITSIDGPNITISYRAVITEWSAVYSKDVEWFTYVAFPTGETWSLIDHGSGFDGEAWLIEHTATAVGPVGGLMWSYGMGEATEFRLTYSLGCSAPGGVDFRIGDTSPVVQPIVSYQDVCPASLERISWHEAVPSLRVETNTLQADANHLLSAGTFRLDGIRSA